MGEGDKPGDALHANDEGPWKGVDTRAMEDDPLGLIRREVAVMKKLEYVIHLWDHADGTVILMYVSCYAEKLTPDRQAVRSDIRAECRRPIPNP